MIVYFAKYENEQITPFIEGEVLKYPDSITYYTDKQDGMFEADIPDDFFKQYKDGKIYLEFKNGKIKCYE